MAPPLGSLLSTLHRILAATLGLIQPLYISAAQPPCSELANCQTPSETQSVHPRRIRSHPRFLLEIPAARLRITGSSSTLHRVHVFSSYSSRLIVERHCPWSRNCSKSSPAHSTRPITQSHLRPPWLRPSLACSSSIFVRYLGTHFCHRRCRQLIIGFL